MILGTPFLLQIQHFNIDTNRLKAIKQNILFKFIQPPKTGIIQQIKTHLQAKEAQLNFFKQDTYNLKINHKLKTPYFKEQLQEFLNNLIKDYCSENPKIFWHRKTHTISLPYITNFSKTEIPTKA